MGVKRLSTKTGGFSIKDVTISSTEIKDETDILLKLWENHWTQERHVDSLLSSITNFVIVISTAILGFFASQGFTKNSLMLSIFLVIIGIYGVITCLHLSGNLRFNVSVANKMINRISELNPDAKINTIISEVEGEIYKTSIFKKNGFSYFWVMFNVLIVFIGIITIYLIIKG